MEAWYYDPSSKVKVIPGQEGRINLKFLGWNLAARRPLKIGDGILNIEFHTKMNFTIGADVPRIEQGTSAESRLYFSAGISWDDLYTCWQIRQTQRIFCFKILIVAIL